MTEAGVVKTWERVALHASSIAVTASGLAYGYLRYFGKVAGEFGPEPHPYQSTLQHAHVLLAPALVLALGFAARGHAIRMLQHHVARGRRTGLGLLVLCTPMIWAGYAIQVVTDPTARTVAAWAHGVGSLLFCAFYAAHWLKALSASAWARASAEGAPRRVSA